MEGLKFLNCAGKVLQPLRFTGHGAEVSTKIRQAPAPCRERRPLRHGTGDLLLRLAAASRHQDFAEFTGSEESLLKLV